MEGRNLTPEEVEAMYADQEASNDVNVQGSSSSTKGGKVSYVWTYFVKEPIGNDNIKYRCVCTVCRDVLKIRKDFAWAVGLGMGAMSRHLKSIHGISASGVDTQTQTQLSGFMNKEAGGGKPFFYSRKTMIGHMATFVNLEELPFTYGESVNLENFNKLALQPAFTRVNRHTLKRATMEQYKEEKRKLIEYFAKFDGRVALTSDLWTTRQNDPYICVTVHWIDHDYFLQKRIIAFDIMEESHTGYNIFLRLKKLDDYLMYEVESNDEDFNILLWWKSRSIQFSLLSKIARDVLVVPASTIASESAFSAGGRVLDERRSSLAPSTVKMCVCKKDWDQAEKRRQWAKEYDPLEEDERLNVEDATSGNNYDS